MKNDKIPPALALALGVGAHAVAAGAGGVDPAPEAAGSTAGAIDTDAGALGEDTAAADAGAAATGDRSGFGGTAISGIDGSPPDRDCRDEDTTDAAAFGVAAAAAPGLRRVADGALFAAVSDEAPRVGPGVFELSSACATPEPAASAAPRPSVTAPAPNHA